MERRTKERGRRYCRMRPPNDKGASWQARAPRSYYQVTRAPKSSTLARFGAPNGGLYANG